VRVSESRVKAMCEPREWVQLKKNEPRCRVSKGNHRAEV
jgi:hypothetical protein